MWWVDPLLGFPKELYRTDFSLARIDPGRRDAVKSGIQYRRSARVTDELFNLLLPDAKFLLLVTSGKTTEALKLLPSVYMDPSVEKGGLDDLADVLAYSGVHDPQSVEETVRFGLETPPLSTFGRRGLWLSSHIIHLSSLFGAFPDPQKRPLLTRYLASPSTRARALGLLAMTGTKEQANLVLPFLEQEISSGESRESGVQQAAVAALSHIGDCSAASRVKALLGDPRSDPRTCLSLLLYLFDCSMPPEQNVVGSVLLRQGGGPFGAYQVLEIADAFRPFRGPSAIPALRRLLDAMPKNATLLNAFEYSTEPEALAELRTALSSSQPALRAQAAELLAEDGDQRALPIAAALGADNRNEMDARAHAIEAFRWFKGPSLRRFLLGFLKKSSDREFQVRGPALRALRWYSDDDAVDVLIAALSEGERMDRDAALESLAWASQPVHQKLRNRLSTMNPISKIYCARALQVSEGDDFGIVFEKFIKEEADKLKDYGALEEAIVGLRDAYLAKPADVAVQALRDPYRTIRLAAALALAEKHPSEDDSGHLRNATSQSSNPELALAAERARWAIGVENRAAAALNQARLAASSGDPGLASRDLDAVGLEGPSGITALQCGLGEISGGSTFLTPNLYSRVFSPRHGDLSWLRSQIDAQRGDVKAAMQELSSLLEERPWMKQATREDAAFAPLHRLYAFRVMTEMQDPISVESIQNPEEPEARAKQQ